MAIYLRGGTWWARYTEADGYEARRSLKTKDQKVANEIYGKILNNVARGLVGLPTVEKSKSIPSLVQAGKAYKDYLLQVKSKPTGLRYEIALDHFLDAMKGLRYVTQVKKENIEAYVADRIKAGMSGKTVNEELRVIESFFDDLVEKEVLSKNPGASVERVDYRVPEALYYPQDLLQEVLTRSREPYRGTYSFLADTGLRIGEFLHLDRHRDVDYSTGSITVRPRGDWRPKTAAGMRQVPLTEDALGVAINWKLEAEKLKARNSYLFHDENIRLLRDEGRLHLLEYVKLIIKEIGIPDEGYGLHTFRHTYGSYLVMAGVDIVTVSRLMGHSSIKETMRYAHLAPDHKRDAVEKLAKFKKKPFENKVIVLKTA